MTAYSSFALVGAGALGSHVASELLKKKISLKILTRDDSKPEFDEFRANGATIVKVDYADEEDLKAAFAGVQVVVSVIGHFGISAQPDIAKAAKAAGVQLFVPAEYGVYVAEGFTRPKKVVQDALTELQLPYTIFYTGFFAETFHAFLGFNYADGKIRVVGTGDVPFGITARTDVARFVAHVLTTADPRDLAWAKISIEGDRKTHHEIAAIAEKRLVKTMALEYVDLEETRKSVTTDVVAFYTTLLADGNSVAGPVADVEAAIAKFFPDWDPKPVDEFIAIA